MDTIFLIQLAAVIAFAVCFIHSWRTEGPRSAQQWFLVGYLFALLFLSLFIVIRQIAFNADMVVFGAAPSLTVMLYPAAFYLAYAVAKRFVEPTNLRAMAYLVFLLTPWFLVPLDVIALSQHWWSFPTESVAMPDLLPFYIPFAWGVLGAAFFLLVGRIREIRFRGNGQLFAMIIGTPLLAAVMLLLVAVVQVIVNQLGAVGGDTLLYVLLALYVLLLPLALVFNIPHIGDRGSRIAYRK